MSPMTWMSAARTLMFLSPVLSTSLWRGDPFSEGLALVTCELRLWECPWPPCEWPCEWPCTPPPPPWECRWPAPEWCNTNAILKQNTKKWITQSWPVNKVPYPFDQPKIGKKKSRLWRFLQKTIITIITSLFVVHEIYDSWRNKFYKCQLWTK